MRSRWIIDNEIPIFSQDTNYVNGRITFVKTIEPTPFIISGKEYK